MRQIVSCIALALPVSAALAELAGPQLPAAPRRTLVEQVGDLYRERYGLEARNVSCAPARAGELVVCGGRSPYRIPLPDERGPREHPRLPTGEIPSAAGGSPPVPGARGAGIAFTIPIGRPAKVTGLRGAAN